MAVRRWGPETQANTTFLGSQGAPDIAALADGGWVLAWVDAAAPLVPLVRFQRFDAAGAAVGGERTIASATPLIKPSILASPDGGFIIAVESRWSAEDADVQAHRFNAAGTLQSVIDIDMARGPSSGEPVLAALGAGSVALHERGGDIFATWYDVAGNRLGGRSRSTPPSPVSRPLPTSRPSRRGASSLPGPTRTSAACRPASSPPTAAP
jgi:hypothetical protein